MHTLWQCTPTPVHPSALLSPYTLTISMNRPGVAITSSGAVSFRARLISYLPPPPYTATVRMLYTCGDRGLGVKREEGRKEGWLSEKQSRGWERLERTGQETE